MKLDQLIEYNKRNKFFSKNMKKNEVGRLAADLILFFFLKT